MLPREQREAYVDLVCQGNAEMRAELLSRLARDQDRSGDLSLLQRAAMPFFRSNLHNRLKGDEIPPGTRVGHYEILNRIGRGGMGVVYKARDTHLDRIVALKFLPRHMAMDEEMKARFILEAKSASSLQHVNICTIYDIAESEDNHSYISMAFCDGTTLEEKIERGPLAVSTALEYVIQVGRGLACAHEHGIVHRDVKPANVLVTNDEVVKIVDFGVAKLFGISLTATGNIVGTTPYLSPEQARGEPVDARTDIWGLGVVLYELLSGERPFRGEYREAVIYSILNEHPIPVAAFCPGIPMPLAHILDRMLEKQLDSRYQRVVDVVVDLEGVRERLARREHTYSSVRDPARSNDAESTHPIRSGGVIRAPGTEPARILVVDDEPEIELLIRQRFQKSIRAHEWSFTFASDGVEALEKLHAQADISLVLTDIRMPRLNGIELLGRLDEIGRPIIAVVMSAYGDMENIRAAMNGGAFDFVTKPIDFSDLEATIRKTFVELDVHRRAIESQQQLVAIQQELDVARRVQEAMVPPPLSKRKDIDLFGFTCTASDVAGDFYDFFAMGEDRIHFLLGDVASRGISAALVIAMCQTFIRGAVADGRSPGECLTSLNRVILADSFPNLSVTIFLAEIDLSSGMTSYCNAGHLHPFLLNDAGSVTRLDGPRGLPIWIDRGLAYDTSHLTLNAEDGLFLFSGDILEAINRHGRKYSIEKLERTLMTRRGASAAEIVRSVVRDVAQFRDGDSQADDFTALALRYLGRESTGVSGPHA